MAEKSKRWGTVATIIHEAAAPFCSQLYTHNKELSSLSHTFNHSLQLIGTSRLISLNNTDFDDHLLYFFFSTALKDSHICEDAKYSINEMKSNEIYCRQNQIEQC